MKKIVAFSDEIKLRYPLLDVQSERRVMLLADDNRQPLAYASEGVSSIPVPVFRWERGQNIDQTLLDLQMPLFEQIVKEAPSCYTALMADASVYLRAGKRLPAIPQADAVCFGLWVDPQHASQHRVFCLKRHHAPELDLVLDKPSIERLGELTHTHLTLMDSGLWLLSEKARQILRERLGAPAHEFSIGNEKDHSEVLSNLLLELDVAIIPIPDGEYYDFGSTAGMIASTMALQNVVQDQRLIIQKNLLRHPSLFTQNARVEYPFTEKNENVWIENSHIPSTWKLSSENVLTGIPENNWNLTLGKGQCINVLPVDDHQFIAQVYEYAAEQTPASSCYCENLAELELALKAMLSGEREGCVSAKVNNARQQAQRLSFLKENIQTIARNHRKSVFYQVNLKELAQKYCEFELPAPSAIEQDMSIMLKIRDAMFRSQLKTLRGEDGSKDEALAFSLLQEGLTASAYAQPQQPHLDVYKDQIVWGRSAVRIDIAGGWTDTPPYCLNAGGNVVNLAIELNGQQPLQVYVKPCKELKVICRSIDLGATETLETYEELAQFNKVGSPFSIPKAALALCGFLPQFAKEAQSTLRDQLAAFGSGIEITLLSAIPAGSGLGTSSILAATVLGALSDFCGLGWDKMAICNRTLILEQLLTTGGGWQDQFGGVLHGVKLLQTTSGFDQTPVTRWLPDQLWNEPENRQCHLLYYTGITRTAKKILAEIVRGMFLNSQEHLAILGAMKQQALDMFDVIQRGDIGEYGRLVRKTWSQNKALDAGTEPPLVYDLCQKIDDLCAGYKLPGAGGGGYLYMVAKDPEAAARIKHILTENPISDSARFVDMRLSQKGLQVSRS